MMDNIKDGFNYDLYEALLRGNIFERVFHRCRLNLWLSRIDDSKKKVLDIGCNTGVILVPLLEKGMDVIGIDINTKDIVKAQRHLKESGIPINRALVADAKKLPFKSNFFDIVILSDILEHVGKPELVAKEAVRVTKPGGLILATVPNELHPVVRYPWVRKLLTGRNNVDEFPDVPFNIKMLRELFPKIPLVEKKMVVFWVEILGVFQKV